MKITRSLLQALSTNPKKIFLADAIAALAAATILFYFGIAGSEKLTGMPDQIINGLALVACLFAIYSFSCYFFIRRNLRPFLQTIIAANILYEMVTAGLVLYYFQQLTIFGGIYFVMEILLMAILLFFEITMLKHPFFAKEKQAGN